jgi:hypothetical protein
LTIGGLDSFKVYEGEAVTAVERDDIWLKSWKKFQVALVPVETGRLEIPAITVIVFNPTTDSYQELTQGPFVIDVLPALMGPPESDGQERSVLVGGNELRANAQGGDDLEPARSLDVQLGLMLAPPIFVGLCGWIVRRRQRWDSDLGFRKRTLALKRAEEGLQALALANENDLPRLYTRVLSEYVGDKLGSEGAALTPVELIARLERTELDLETRERLLERLRWAERLRYGVSSEPLSGVNLVEEARSFIRVMEAAL